MQREKKAFMSKDEEPEIKSKSNSEENYLKIGEDETVKVRILTSREVEGMGHQIFKRDESTKKSIVYKSKDPADLPKGDIAKGQDNKTGEEYEYNKKPSSVWNVVIYNYTEKLFQVWSISQKTIQNALNSYRMDEDFGDPQDYDIKITKKKVGKNPWDIEYHSMPLLPKKAFDEDLQKQFDELDLPSLDVLFEKNSEGHYKNPFDEKVKAEYKLREANTVFNGKDEVEIPF